jgi:hypothetical protein
VTIIEFLEARIAEDELAAHAAIDTAADWLAHYDYRDVKDSDGHYVVQADTRYPSAAQAAHIARHDPARVLRECDTKRTIIADFLRRDALGDLPGRKAAEEALRSLAAVYSRHPDFDRVWA